MLAGQLRGRRGQSSSREGSWWRARAVGGGGCLTGEGGEELGGDERMWPAGGPREQGVGARDCCCPCRLLGLTEDTLHVLL